MKSFNIKKISKKKIIEVSIGLLFTLITIAYCAYLFQWQVFGWSPYQINSSNKNNNTNEQIYNGNLIKEKSTENNQPKSGSSGSDQPPAPINQPNDKSLVEVSITATNQISGLLQIRSLISALDISGACTLTMQPESGTTIIKIVEVQASSNTSTCKGFDIPISDLHIGKWQITITYESIDLIGSATKVINIE